MAEDDVEPFVALSGEPSTTSGSQGSMAVFYAVVHSGNTATVIALRAETLTPIGHLAWTISKPGGRRDAASGGEQIAVGEINSVFTRGEWTRRGIATGMYAKAREVAEIAGWPTTIDHSPNRTDPGEAWAARVTGYVPPWVPVRPHLETRSALEVLAAFVGDKAPDGEERAAG